MNENILREINYLQIPKLLLQLSSHDIFLHRIVIHVEMKLNIWVGGKMEKEIPFAQFFPFYK